MVSENPNDPRTRIRKLNRIITGWQRHIDRMAKIFGCFGIQDEVEEAARKLKAENAELTTKLAEAEAEVERLQEALEYIADSPHILEEFDTHGYDIALAAKDAAAKLD